MEELFLAASLAYYSNVKWNNKFIFLRHSIKLTARQRVNNYAFIRAHGILMNHLIAEHWAYKSYGWSKKKNALIVEGNNFKNININVLTLVSLASSWVLASTNFSISSPCCLRPRRPASVSDSDTWPMRSIIIWRIFQINFREIMWRMFQIYFFYGLRK